MNWIIVKNPNMREEQYYNELDNQGYEWSWDTATTMSIETALHTAEELMKKGMSVYLKAYYD